MELLTNSRLSALARCPKMHYLRYEMGLRRIRLASPLRMGSAYHAGLEALNLGRTEAAVYDAATDGYRTAPAWADPKDWAVERETVANLIAGYIWRYKTAPLKIARTPDGKPAVELEFKFSLINPRTGRASRTFWLAGKIDAIVILPDGRLAVWECKTTSDDIGPDSDFWLQLRADPQISLYTIAARTLGFNVACVIYDVARKPAIRPRQIPQLDSDGKKIVLDEDGLRVRRVNILKSGKPGKSHDEPIQSGSSAKGWVLQTKTESPTEYGIRLLADITEQPDRYYARREVPRLDDELQEFAAELWQRGKELRERQRAGRWFRTVSKWTCGNCDYKHLCLEKIRVNPDAPPPVGYEFAESVHPELEQEEGTP